MLDQTLEPTVLKLRQIFNAPPERVFRAWTNPAMLMQWFRAGPDATTTVAEVDLRVGGRYRLGMYSTKTKQEHIATGVFRRIKPYEQLVFTWAWEGTGGKDTLVTIDFHSVGGKTELILMHENFPDEKERDGHAEGWHGCLTALEEFLSSG